MRVLNWLRTRGSLVRILPGAPFDQGVGLCQPLFVYCPSHLQSPPATWRSQPLGYIDGMQSEQRLNNGVCKR